jgi:hypothetical protein
VCIEVAQVVFQRPAAFHLAPPGGMYMVSPAAITPGASL